jgi:hypothetical protein
MMKTIIDREARDEEEVVAFEVQVQSGPPAHWQFKIELWAREDDWVYNLRLDGFSFLRLYRAKQVDELFLALTYLDASEVTQWVKQWCEALRAISYRLPDGATHLPDDQTVVAYFEAARKATLKEMQALMTAELEVDEPDVDGG